MNVLNTNLQKHKIQFCSLYALSLRVQNIKRTLVHREQIHQLKKNLKEKSAYRYEDTVLLSVHKQFGLKLTGTLYIHTHTKSKVTFKSK